MMLSSKLVLFCLLSTAFSYLPIFIMHGITGSNYEYRDMLKWIEKYHPGTYVNAMPVDNFFRSTKSLWVQLDDVVKYMEQEISKNSTIFQNGFHVIGHSQGGLLMRAVLETWTKHNVTNFISLAGVQNGEYGIPEVSGMGVVEIALCEAATKILYSESIQNIFGVANFWRDYHFDNYVQKNKFLPIINNEKNFNSTYYDNFVRIKHFYLFGSPADEVISPWQSSLFGQYQSKDFITVPLEEQYVYKNDSFGLRTMDKQGRITQTTVPNVSHQGWVSDESVFVNYILPLLT